MHRPEALIAIVAFVVAILVAFGIYHLTYQSPNLQMNSSQCPPVPEMKEIMIAHKLINTGEPIESAITYEKWPVSSLRSNFYFKNKISEEALKQLIARRVINQGEPITEVSVVDRKARGVLSALLTEGMRAFSIAIDQNSGMSALVNPGDIVDVLLSPNSTGKENEDTNRTVLCGVRVLAVDQHLSVSIDSMTKKVTEPTQSPKSVTLEVTPSQASALASAIKLGTLTLSLHSTSDGKNTCLESGLKPADQIKIIRGDSTQITSQQGR